MSARTAISFLSRDGMRRIAVIGGGAAGMMAAYFAADGNSEVTIYERNQKLGKKLFITGKGRCNLTNDCDTQEFFDSIPTNPKFLLSAVYGFTPQDVMNLFEKEAGIPLKVERGNRVFPLSDKSSDIIRGFSRLLSSKGVHIRLNSHITGISADGGRVCGIFAGKEFVPADAVIIATGGLSYPATGSTGDGYAFAKSAGHTVTPLSPSLVGIVTRRAGMFTEARGLTLKNVGLTLQRGAREIYSDQGELLITHFGISGPLVLSASAHIKSDPRDYRVAIDLKPALDEKKLDARILRDFDAQKNKQLKNALFGLLPKSLVSPVLNAAGLSGEKSVNTITKEERSRLAGTLKALCMEVEALRSIDEAIVTRGGVSVKEIDPGTMESKKLPGLYFAGEIIDTDGYTGGFNLQIAFSTGRLAGICASGSNK